MIQIHIPSTGETIDYGVGLLVEARAQRDAGLLSITNGSVVLRGTRNSLCQLADREFVDGCELVRR